MNDNHQLGTVSSKQLAGTLLALILGCFIEASSDWLATHTDPSLTLGAIAIDTVVFFIVGLVIGVPITMFFWNRLLAPIFQIPRVKYVHALVIISAVYWINGLG